MFSGKINAASYVCIDSLKEANGDADVVCDPDSTDYSEAYYMLVSIERRDIVVRETADGSVSTLTIPNTILAVTGNVEVPVKVIGDGVSPLIAYDSANIVDEIVLPSNVSKLSSNSLAGFAHIEKITFPKSMANIEENIFHESASVNNIYILGYIFSDKFDDIVVIAENAFAEGVVNNIICEDHTVYNFYKTHYSELKFNYLLTKITYNYYPHVKSTTPIKTRDYYYADNLLVQDSDIEDGIEVIGMTFTGWNEIRGSNVCDLEVGKIFCFKSGERVYHIYPKFTLNPVTNINPTYIQGEAIENITNNKMVVTYDGLTRTLGLTHDLHVVATQKIVWYKDGVEIVPNIYKFYDSGVYKYEITSTYNHQGQPYTNIQQGEVEVVINQKAIHVYTNNVEQTYGVGLKASDCKYRVEGLASIHTSVVNLCKYNSEVLDETPLILDAGEYLSKIQVEITAIKKDEYSENEKDNYTITYHSGNYKVLQKRITVSYTQKLEVEYGSAIVIENVYQDSDTNQSVGIRYGKSAGLTVGTYNIISAQSKNANYYAIFDAQASIGKVVIVAKGIDVVPVLNNDTYDGKAKKLSLSYTDVVTGAKIELDYTVYKNGEQVDSIVGASDYYMAEVSELEDENYYINGHKELEDNPYQYDFKIFKALPQVDLEKVRYQTVEYTGEKIEPHVIVNNSEQTPIYTCKKGDEVDPEGCINAGLYKVSVSVAVSENYKDYYFGDIIFTINPRAVSVRPQKYTFYYDEPIEAKQRITVVNPNGSEENIEIVYRTSAKQGDYPGIYKISEGIAKIPTTNSDNTNFKIALPIDDCLDKIEIVKRPVNIVYFDYTNLVYNGKVRQVGVRAVDVLTDDVVFDVNLSDPICDEGEIKNANTYHLRTYVDDPRYVLNNSNLLVFSIEKATYDLSNIKFESKQAVLNFNKHSVFISGNLPSGVEVEYTIDGKEGNSTSKGFKHTVVAKFIGDSINYHPIESMEATIYIDTTWVFVTIAGAILLAGAIVGLILLYNTYRRTHPKKIKLKIRQLVHEDLEAKRIATSVEDVLGDYHQKEEVIEYIEDDNDLIEENTVVTNFIDRIYAADSELKYYYSEVKNELLSYDGVMHTVDRKYEVFYHGPRQIAKLSICNNILRLYINLPPEKYDKNLYKHKDMSKFECHARTPLRLDVDSEEALRNAKVLIRILRKKEKLQSFTGFVKIDYEKFYTLKEYAIPKFFKKIFSADKTKKKHKK